MKKTVLTAFLMIASGAQANGLGAAYDYFKVNAGSDLITCGNIVNVSTKQESLKIKDYVVTCSNNETYRIISQPMGMMFGKPTDKWSTAGFKCSNLPATTIKGWQDPRDFGINSANCKG